MLDTFEVTMSQFTWPGLNLIKIIQLKFSEKGKNIYHLEFEACSN